MTESLDIQTRLLHHRHKTDPHNGAVSVGVQHASTFHQNSLEQFGAYDYARSGNPTREALEEIFAGLENGTDAFAFASGMAAISTTFMLLSSGDHLVITEDVYGGTFRMTTEVLTRLGIEHTFVDMTRVDEVKATLQDNTKMIFMETPSNPTMKITPIRDIVALAEAHDCLTVLDNTFMTPVLQRPLDLGVDIVVHSATKFIGGHSDVVSGLAVVKRPDLAGRLGFLQNSFGAIPGPDDCWLIMRGLKTLHTRMMVSQEVASNLAHWLDVQPEVKRVYYPGFSDQLGNAIHAGQSDGPGAVLSFELADREAVSRFSQAVEIPVFAVSLGAVESILSYPAKMSHAAMPDHERVARGITDGLLRLSVGLESEADLKRDFRQAFDSLARM
ncbi:Cystathionine gamma-lyase [[Bacillus] selenitireducens MLS10]|uniref:cysteine-S-conjugate beta-lyase n=2 Tax=Salisediminibacterium selenitireducens TaxID=85683 RepID=D6XXG5_BACIE|nr:aminotransferase class V-fold PLP-dependent enzyme [Salisediminibacterium selenitireducens]ADH98022.1 Cystathionine gamma-lyase [[Bacillus] selenitireducens MLS10]